jgi:hypothetical protein
MKYYYKQKKAAYLLDLKANRVLKVNRDFKVFKARMEKLLLKGKTIGPMKIRMK